MERLANFPPVISYIGIIVSFILLIVMANISEEPNMSILIAALVILHLSVWMLAVKYILIAFGFFGAVLGK